MGQKIDLGFKAIFRRFAPSRSYFFFLLRVRDVVEDALRFFEAVVLLLRATVDFFLGAERFGFFAEVAARRVLDPNRLAPSVSFFGKRGGRPSSALLPTTVPRAPPTMAPIGPATAAPSSAPVVTPATVLRT